MSNFTPQARLTDVGKNILKTRYYIEGETKWGQNSNRIINTICADWDKPQRLEMSNLLFHRYFVPNSPLIANAGKEKHAGYSACFVVPFEDTIESIYKTKLDFALVARKGGGCGTTLSNIRPEGDPVGGSTHGYAGGGIGFADTISRDMEVITQGGLRAMALMFTMRVDHPDIKKFIVAKSEDNKINNANISVFVTDEFMRAVESGDKYWTTFNGKRYEELDARDVFNSIVEGAWRNGDPGLLFADTINNNSSYLYDGVTIDATNPCGEQPLPPFGSCNLGALDISKFLRNGEFDFDLFERAVRLSIRFLDAVIDKNEFPTNEFKDNALKYRPLGAGLMGLADYYLKRKIAYGSKEALNELDKIGAFYKKVAYNESEIMGDELGVPEGCKNLPVPRRNITVMTIAPTGTTSLIAGCNSGIEPFFSEITQRKDTTGEYTIETDDSKEDYFRCAVPSDGDKSKEVTWEEHILTQATIQKHIDSAVSKTINFPQLTRKETIAKAFMMAWKEGCKGVTIYRNGSRSEQVLTPKNIKKNLCPVCGEPTIKYDGCTRCSKCEWSLCTV